MVGPNGLERLISSASTYHRQEIEQFTAHRSKVFSTIVIHVSQVEIAGRKCG
jgi:hypothetical protein